MSAHQQVDVLHFPFLAVLACVIGSMAFLLFIFVAYSKDLVDTSKIKEEVLASRSLQEEKREELTHLDRLLQAYQEQLSGKVVPEPQQLLEARTRLTRLQSQAAEISLRRERLLARLKKDQAVLEKLKARIEPLEVQARLKRTGRPVAVFVEHKKRPGLPAPLFVECGRDTAVVWPEGKAIEVPQREARSVSFGDWLVRNGAFAGSGYVVFLVRPEGIAVFSVLRAMAEASGWKVGYEPVLSQWELFF